MQTRVTGLLKTEYPIIQGGMAWVADYHLAAAVSNGGGLGMHRQNGLQSRSERSENGRTDPLASISC